MRQNEANPMTGRIWRLNWVCWDCRTVVRRSGSIGPAPVVRCPGCGADCVSLGVKIPVPRKNDTKAWKRLRTTIALRRIAERETRMQSQLVHRHLLEKQIERLESRPDDLESRRAIRQLRKQLAEF